MRAFLPALKARLPAHEGGERKRIENRLKKVTTLTAEIAKQHHADLIRENLRNLKFNGKKKSKQLNYRLFIFPHCKFTEYVDYKFYKQGLA